MGRQAPLQEEERQTPQGRRQAPLQEEERQTLQGRRQAPLQEEEREALQGRQAPLQEEERKALQGKGQGQEGQEVLSRAQGATSSRTRRAEAPGRRPAPRTRRRPHVCNMTPGQNDNTLVIRKKK